MTRFSYQAVRRNGETVAGELEASDKEAVIRRLQGQDLIPIRIRRAGGVGDWLRRSPGRTFGAKEIAVFTRELSTLLGSGLTLDRSLQLLTKLAQEERSVQVIEGLQKRVRGGSTFAAALEDQDGQFPRLCTSTWCGPARPVAPWRPYSAASPTTWNAPWNSRKASPRP